MVRYARVGKDWAPGAPIKLSHDYCNLIGSHNIPRLHTESRLQSPDVPFPPRTSGPRDYLVPRPRRERGKSGLVSNVSTCAEITKKTGNRILSVNSSYYGTVYVHF